MGDSTEEADALEGQHRAKQQRHSGFSEPTSPCGPIMAIRVVNIPSAYKIEKPIVLNMKIPNWLKNRMKAPRRKAEAPRVVIAPESTEMPTSSSADCVRRLRSE